MAADIDASGKPSPSAPCVQVTPDISIQSPLSRRGNGPGLVLVVSENLDLSWHEKTLDPPPLQKWAEEGYCVAQIRIHEGSNLASQLGIAVAELQKRPECTGEKFGLIGNSPNARTPLRNVSADQVAGKQYLTRTRPATSRCLTPSGLRK